ncbi:DNA helicase mcm9 [Coemansia sp. Benny D160-2]|nr:DNA helicase mcm9 [Coemansia sp. Benny D160-2]
MVEVIPQTQTQTQSQQQQLEEVFGSDAGVVGAMQLFLQTRCSEQLAQLEAAADDDDGDDNGGAAAGISVDMHELASFSHELATLLLESPVRHLRLLEQAAATAMAAGGSARRPRRKAAVRIEHLPNHPAVARTRAPGSAEVGRLVSVSGTVVRTGVVKMMETRRRYRCARCGGEFDVQAEAEQYNHLARPTRCLARGAEPCTSTAFAPAASVGDAEIGDAADRCIDYQEIKVQEQAERLALGSIPRAVAVLLEAGLVDCAKSGDAVTVVGVVVWRWRAPAVGERPDIAVAVRASSVRVRSAAGTLESAAAKDSAGAQSEELAMFRRFWRDGADRPVAARNAIVAAVCPQVHGLFYAKLAVALTLVGGVGVGCDASGLRVRGDGHLLLVGDPGTAKSQLLRHAARLAPRAVLTTGVGSTSAGLTVAAVRDGGEWQLEAGALVLADRGVCCIDEFGSIRDAEKATILEAMEQQSISVAKAGIVCRLNARCSVVAAMNPKGAYDAGASLAVNTALPAPLLSRFDLVLVMLDAPDAAWDARVSQFVLAGGSARDQPDQLWPLATLRAYFAFVKAAFEPQTTAAAERVLTAYYRLQRQRDGASAARTTIRLLESLIRLAQAHARLMFRAKVLVPDAVAAVLLMEATMLSASLIPGVDALRSLPAADADADYARLQRTVLGRLGLAHLA